MHHIIINDTIENVFLLQLINMLTSRKSRWNNKIYVIFPDEQFELFVRIPGYALFRR